MDVIANMLTAILNAQRVQKERVTIPYSVFKESLARFFQERGLVSAQRVQSGPTPKLILTLAYTNGKAKIYNLRRLSKPGLRRYVSCADLPYNGGRPGFYVISTAHGLMDEKQAREKQLGGELICEVHST